MPLLIDPVRSSRARYDAGHELARLAKAQRLMLPQNAPKIPGYDIALAYFPAGAATGDYHDFFTRQHGRPALFVGDGSGHGAAASVLGATARAIFHTFPELHGEPGTALTTVNRLLVGLIPSDMFMTGVYMALDPCGQVDWASAGHTPPTWISRSGQLTSQDLASVRLPLGVNPGEMYPTVRWQLQQGDRLLLFTDGLWEVRNRHGRILGYPRLEEELARYAGFPLREVIRALVARAVAHLQGNQFEDDFTVVLVERCAA